MEEMPRRMKRFQRKKQEKKVVEKLKGVPAKKQKDFTEKLKIEKAKPDEVASALFEQIKVKPPFRKRQVAKIQKKKEEKKTPFSKKGVTKTSSEEEIPLWKQKRIERLGKQPAETKTEVKEEKKEKKKGKRGRGRGKKEETKKQPFSEKKLDQKAEELKGTKISGLFGDIKEKPELAEKEMKLDLNLEDDSGLDSGELKGIKSAGEKKEGACVNCGKKFTVLIFCPKCGNAFCDKCAKAKRTEGAKTKYTCPHCGNIVKK